MGNMLYVNADGEWYGGDISDEMAEGQAAAGEEMDGAGAADPADIAMALEGLDLSAAVSTTREADAEMMGQSMAVFTTNVDAAQVVVTLLTFPPVLQALMDAMGGDTAGMDEMELTPEDVQMLGMIFAPMLAGTQISLTRWVGVDDGYIHHIEFLTDLSLDVSMFASGEGAPTEPIVGNISLTSDLANFNESFDITPPAEFRPLEELEGEAEALGM